MNFDRGQQALIRGRRWEIREVRPYDGITAVSVNGVDRDNLGLTRTFIYPHDAIQPFESPPFRWRLGQLTRDQ